MIRIRKKIVVELLIDARNEDHAREIVEEIQVAINKLIAGRIQTQTPYWERRR